MTPERVGKTDGQADGAETPGEAIRTAAPPAVLPPLLAPSAGAFAAATVMGLGLANQMAGAYLGFLKGAVETSKAMADIFGVKETLDEQSAALDPEPAPNEAATILPMARKAKPAGEAGEPSQPGRSRASTATAKATQKPAGAKRKPKAGTADAGEAGDLKRLPGVGPKLEQMLKARGIATLADVAALNDAQTDALDQALGLEGRIARDGWVETAARLTRN